MRRGQILGEVWATRKADGLLGRQFKLVALYEGAADCLTGTVVVALDTLDARAGQDVLVAFGSGARNVLAQGGDNRGILCDAAIALLIDSPDREV